MIFDLWDWQAKNIKAGSIKSIPLPINRVIFFMVMNLVLLVILK